MLATAFGRVTATAVAMHDWSKNLARDGYVIAQDVVSSGIRADLLPLFERPECGAGQRIGLDHSAIQAVILNPDVAAIARHALGEGAFAVKATLFDKTDATNWFVPWHQDVMIPVSERHEAADFDAWSNKDGVVHVRPPTRVLETMLAIRLDLDGTPATNGPLRVLPGSHTHGILGREQIEHHAAVTRAVACEVPQHGALVMRPLLVHASSRATIPARRRVLHLEFANEELPAPSMWHARVAIAGGKPADHLPARRQLSPASTSARSNASRTPSSGAQRRR